MRVDRSLYSYKLRRGDQADLKTRIKEITETRVRYGYRRVQSLHRREEWTANPKRIYRLYKEMGLQGRNKPQASRQGQAASRPDGGVPGEPDMGHGLRSRSARDGPQAAYPESGRHFLPLLAGDDPRFSYPGKDVVQSLERICGQIGYSKAIQVDQGSEFISRVLDLWAYQKDMVLDFSRPGKPTDNAFIESLNGKFRPSA